MKTAGVIVIGNEILSGKVEEVNARFLIAELRTLGVALRRIAFVPDEIEEIAREVRAFSDRFDYVFTSGGVGPTHDDLTMEGIARGLDTRVIRHAKLESLLRAHYGAPFHERNLRMAEVPEGATLLPGADQKWPVIAARNVFILPGIPEIFRRKFEAIREQFRTQPFHLRTVYLTEDEGAIAHHLDRTCAAFPGVDIGSYPKLDPREYRVKVTIEGKDRDEVERATSSLLSFLPEGSIVRTGDS